MKFGVVAARFALVVACAFSTVVPAQARFWQCAPYAREISGIQIFGNANTWWSQAAGKYDRGQTPEVGAVLSFRSTGHMRLGHVATVTAVVSDREVVLNHANWSRRGGIEMAAHAIDVSAAGDWSMVKVTYGQGLGTTAYPTNGFIYAGGKSHDAFRHATPDTDEDDTSRATVQIASLDAGHVAHAIGVAN
ncbi:MAG: CHAP domain-containing protein [Sphingomonas sp.]|uniref:CHAP domain-containing protein n=1 Tax=Sphingomonas sp. TaxID=28214 RepID=UPI001AC74B6E|nr:CHAP domain-containing protein [Sphingomonas sp.]MBN8807942.1 CHAP domain-containing protein [Sphingomonas sp.]